MDEDSICYQCKFFTPGYSEYPNYEAAPGFKIDYPPECGNGYYENFGTIGGCFDFKRRRICEEPDGWAD